MNKYIFFRTEKHVDKRYNIEFERDKTVHWETGSTYYGNYKFPKIKTYEFETCRKNIKLCECKLDYELKCGQEIYLKEISLHEKINSIAISTDGSYYVVVGKIETILDMNDKELLNFENNIKRMNIAFSKVNKRAYEKRNLLYKSLFNYDEHRWYPKK